MFHTGASPLTVFGRVTLIVFAVLIVGFGGAKLALDYQASLEDEETTEVETTPSATTTSTETATSTPTATPVEAGATLTNPFDVTTAKVGDTVVGMSIVSVGLPNSGAGTTISGENAEVQFSGEATLTGTYTYHGNDGLLSDVVSFEPDESSAAKLPKMIGDERTLWFVFSNGPAALDIFGPQSGTSTASYSGNATVTVKNYYILSFPGEVANGAELVSVISKD